MDSCSDCRKPIIGSVFVCGGTSVLCEKCLIGRHQIKREQLVSRYILRRNGVATLSDADVDCILRSFTSNGKEILNLVTILDEPYVFWDLDRVAHHRPHIRVDVMEVTYAK